MTKWIESQLANVTSLVSRGVPPSYTEDEEGILVINQRCIRANTVLYENCRRTDASIRKIATHKYLQDFDILVNSTGVGTLGRLAQLKRPIESQITVDSHVTIVRPDVEIVSPSYLGLAMIASQSQIESMAEGATGQTELSRTRLGELIISLPPLPIQHKIASILSAYDDLIENNTRRIKILEEMAQTIYREWFVHFRFPGHENVPMVDSELGQIPQGWEVKKVENAFEITGGGTPSTKIEEYWDGGDINWYVPSDLTGQTPMFTDKSETQITAEGLKNSSAKLFPANSVMMTSRATIGVVSINSLEACTNQGFIICIPNQKLPTEYIFYWLRSNVWLFIQQASGTTFLEINRSTFKRINLILPHAGILESFTQAVGAVMLEVHALSQKNQNLRKTRDLLLPRLISGRLDVEELEIEGL